MSITKKNKIYLFSFDFACQKCDPSSQLFWYLLKQKDTERVNDDENDEDDESE